MKGLRKKLIALAAVAALATTTFVGCASVKDSDIVATVDDSKITAGMANFYARLQQPDFESYYVSYQNYMQQQMYGSIVQEAEMDWRTEQEEGVTLEDSFKEDTMKALQNLYLSEDHMDEYDVKITEDEQKEIEKTAKAFLKANSKETKEKISADKDTVVEFLKLMTISVKVEQAIKDGVDKEVSAEESNQKRLRYVSFSTTKTNEDSETVEMSDKEKKEVKKEAEEFLEAAKAAESLEAYATEKEATSSTSTFGADYEEDTELTLPTEVYEAADALKANEYAKVVETDSAYYVVQLESELDEDATQTKKESIITERETEAVNDTIEKWREDAKIKVYDKVWDKISMQDLEVTQKAVEEDTAEDDATEDVVEESTEDTTEE